MKNLLLLIFILCVIRLHAQSNESVKYSSIFVKCRGNKIIYDTKGHFKSPLITLPDQEPFCFYEKVPFGNPDTTWIENVKFEYIPEVLNYMSINGWIPVQTNVVKERGLTSITEIIFQEKLRASHGSTY